MEINNFNEFSKLVSRTNLITIKKYKDFVDLVNALPKVCKCRLKKLNAKCEQNYRNIVFNLSENESEALLSATLDQEIIFKNADSIISTISK